MKNHFVWIENPVAVKFVFYETIIGFATKSGLY